VSAHYKMRAQIKPDKGIVMTTKVSPQTVLMTDLTLSPSMVRV
jgi:hypothetical protein